ncbi:unnamed protein product, partial [Gulo gulo]
MRPIGTTSMYHCKDFLVCFLLSCVPCWLGELLAAMKPPVRAPPGRPACT